MEKVDFKKKYKTYFNCSNKKVEFVDLPEMLYVMADGKGDPNSDLFPKVVEALYGLSYTLKFMFKKNPDLQPKGYYDWVVPPMEGLWWMEGQCFDETKRDEWLWTIIIMQPEFITKELFERAQVELKKKKCLDTSFVRLEYLHEGKAAQIKHIGPYTTEQKSIDAVFKAIEENGLKLHGKHHEIYLSDPRKTAPEKLKTIIRHPCR